MKLKLLPILFSLLTLPVSAEEQILYCSEDERVGFVVSESYKFSRFNKKRFKAKVDFDNNVFILKDVKDPLIFLNTSMTIAECHLIGNDFLCTSGLGSTIEFNTQTLKFHFAFIGHVGDILISHGSCEEF